MASHLCITPIGSIRRKGGSEPLRKVISEVKDVENQMQRDETTAYQLCKILRYSPIGVSLCHYLQSFVAGWSCFGLDNTNKYGVYNQCQSKH